MVIWNAFDVIGFIAGVVVLVGYILFIVGYNIYDKIKKKKRNKK